MGGRAPLQITRKEIATKRNASKNPGGEGTAGKCGETVNKSGREVGRGKECGRFEKLDALHL